ncbi:MAG: SDR family oxidoreductase [Candidatus Hydrogenedentes bacterium]|nr:SDR family oxidoreductase [Candidatus Hydrogenedentota bacterium]
MYSNRHFFLTGCAGGIGGHLVEALAKQNANIFATDFDSDALHRRVDESRWPSDRVTLQALDVRDPEAWERVFQEAVDKLGTIDVAMNIAGCLFANWAVDAPREQVDLQFDVNVKGVIFGTQVAARHMLSRAQGHIINIASMASLAPIPGLSVYCATKYAVRAFSIAAAHELRPKGVHVSVVCPDTVRTDLWKGQWKREETRLAFSGRRVLTVEDVTRIILGRVLTKKSLLTFFPASRGLLARAADLFPASGGFLLPSLMERGRIKQTEFKDET